MSSLEEAISSERPEESALLSMVHSRLLCSNRELKGLKPGEHKYPYRRGGGGGGEGEGKRGTRRKGKREGGRNERGGKEGRGEGDFSLLCAPLFWCTLIEQVEV